jgi:predicted permease
LHFGLLKARGATGRDRKLNQLLAGAEVALAMMLLMGAGLLANSLLHLTRVDPGFDADRTIVLGLGLPQTRYTTPEIRAAFFDRLEREIEAMPEVAEATVSNGVPPHTVFSFGLVLQAEGAEPITSESDPVYLPRIGTRPDYLATVGGRLLNGRDLTDADIGTDNVLIDDQLAAALWSDDAVGRRMRVDADGPWYTVVGVFQHMTMMGLDDRQAPYALIHPRNPSQASAYMFLGIRPTGDPRAALVPIRRVVHDMDPLLPIWILEAARSQLVDTIEQPRFLAKVMIALSFTALFLAAVGIYGVLSYAVTRRRREMGIRLALGARPDNVRQLFLRQGLLVTCLGIAVGLLTGMALTRLVRSLLFGVASSDPLTLGIAALVMASTAALASYLPARRATRVDPVEVLRTE